MKKNAEIVSLSQGDICQICRDGIDIFCSSEVFNGLNLSELDIQILSGDASCSSDLKLRSWAKLFSRETKVLAIWDGLQIVSLAALSINGQEAVIDLWSDSKLDDIRTVSKIIGRLVRSALKAGVDEIYGLLLSGSFNIFRKSGFSPESIFSGYIDRDAVRFVYNRHLPVIWYRLFWKYGHLILQ